MAVYRPKYRDKKTGELVESEVYWYEFTFAGKRHRDSTKQTLKTLASEVEKDERRKVERAYAGLPHRHPRATHQDRLRGPEGIPAGV